MLEIGNIRLEVPVMTSPMAGISDLPFRIISRSFGSQLAFTEMIDINAISQKDKRTTHMLSSCAEDRPLGVQFLGNSQEQIPLAVERLRGHDVDLIDFNAACPSPKVTRKGKGAALLNDPVKLGKILSELVRTSPVPVAVKIRAGWDENSVNARDIALRAQDAGIDCLFIHGRTKTQGYSGNVDYKIIRIVKDALAIPVVASGDNLSIARIRKMFDETGCDAVAIARGALGNPWIFREAVNFFRNGTLLPPPAIDERIEVMKRHLEMSVAHWGEKRGVGIFHKFFIWYTRGFGGLRSLRDKAFRTGTKNDLIAVIEELASIPPRFTRLPRIHEDHLPYLTGA